MTSFFLKVFFLRPTCFDIYFLVSNFISLCGGLLTILFFKFFTIVLEFINYFVGSLCLAVIGYLSSWTGLPPTLPSMIFTLFNQLVGIVDIYWVLFFVLKFFILFTAFMVIISPNPIHAVLYLICLFVSTALLFLLLGAEFLGLLLIIVYVGAIAVLFLFVVMMLNINQDEFGSGIGRFRYLVASLLLTLIFINELSDRIYGHFGFFRLETAPIYDFGYYEWVVGLVVVDNLRMLGYLIYTHYFHLLILVGFILFVAMLSSIVLTQPWFSQNKLSSKAQNKYSQLSRTVRGSVILSYWRPRT